MTDVDKDKVIIPGLTCTNCGACCRHIVRPPFIYLEDPEWERVKAERPDLVDELDRDSNRRDFEVPAPCLWYDPIAKNCKHYEYRPEICREFVPGTIHCLNHREQQGIVLEIGMVRHE